MSRLYSFPPIAGPTAKILILGSMPGQASLDANQYYAHPRNLFWKLMAEMLGFQPTQPYDEKAAHLIKAHVAVWDVLQSCQRQGSLDVHIRHEEPNDFPSFLKTHPHIQAIFFNGDKAATSFKRFVQPQLQGSELALIRLPSTSPANASQNYEMKRDAWRQIMEYLI